MKQLDQGEIAATARARLHGDMVTQRNEVQVPRPQAPRPVPPAMNPAFSYPGEESFQKHVLQTFRSIRFKVAKLPLSSNRARTSTKVFLDSENWLYSRRTHYVLCIGDN